MINLGLNEAKLSSSLVKGKNNNMLEPINKTEFFT